MDFMEEGIHYRDRMLHYWEESCRAWCIKEGLEFTTGARLAHYALGRLEYGEKESLPPADILPRPSRDEAAWRALSEWRHPQINLNLLQLAFVFKDYFLQEYLWQPIFLQEQDYRDDSSQLVNHPLHLDYAFSVGQEINLDYIRDELFYEEGFIDLTPSRVLTQTESNVSASGLSKASVLKSDFSLLVHSALEGIMFQMATSANRSLFHQAEPIQMASLYNFNNILNVVQKLSGQRAQPSTVELMWAIATSTTRVPSNNRPQSLYSLDNIPPTHSQELLILLCQCTFTDTDARLREKRLDDLSQLFWRLSFQQNMQTEKAVRFLSTSALEKTIRFLQIEEAEHTKIGSVCPRPLVSQVLKDQLACRSLLDLCVLTVLEAVRGDVRKVWGLEQLPEPVKQLFHIPFEQTYQELKAEEQG